MLLSKGGLPGGNQWSHVNLVICCVTVEVISVTDETWCVKSCARASCDDCSSSCRVSVRELREEVEGDVDNRRPPAMVEQ